MDITHTDVIHTDVIHTDVIRTDATQETHKSNPNIHKHIVFAMYTSTSTIGNLKRLSTVTLSPIYAYFSKSFNGLTFIRAMRGLEEFADENRSRLEINQRAKFGGKISLQILNRVIMW